MSRLNVIRLKTVLVTGKRHFHPALLLSFLLTLVTISVMEAQNEPEPPVVQSGPTLSTKAPSAATRPDVDRRVTLDVRVTDKSGALIRGLREQDFAILDDKNPQKIAAFQAVDAHAPAASDPPVEVVLVIDAAGAWAADRESTTLDPPH